MIDVAMLVADTVARDDEDTAYIVAKHERNLTARAHYRRDRIIRRAASILCALVHEDRNLRGCPDCRTAVAQALEERP